MRKAPPLEGVFVPIVRSATRGAAEARITLIEFSDYQCPYCAAFAEKAAEVAGCAGDQGKYWEMHDRLFNEQQSLTEPRMTEFVTALALYTSEFRQCLETAKYARNVERDISDGEKLGVKGTPTFFLGYVDSKDPSRIHALKSFNGIAPFRNFQAAIEELLESDSGSVWGLWPWTSMVRSEPVGC